MDDDVVDAAAAIAHVIHEISGKSGVFREHVQRQRLFVAFDVVDHVQRVFVLQDGEDRAEDLLLHHRIVRCDVRQDRWFDLQQIFVQPSAVDGLRRIDQGRDAVEMLFVDDLSIILVVEIIAELAFRLADDRFEEGFLDILMHEHIIRGDAGLAAVQELAEHDAPCGHLDLGVLIHDDRALAAQFQRAGGQMLRGFFQNGAAYGLAAGEEDLVPFLFQERRVLFPAAGHDCRVCFGKRRAHDLRHDIAGRGRIRRRFDHHGVARRDGVHRGFQRQQDGIVPGAHDQHVPQRFRMHVGPGGELRQRRALFLISRQLIHVADLPVDLRQQHAGLAHVAFHLGFAQILLQTLRDLALITDDGLPQFEQRLGPVIRVERGAGGEERPLFPDDASQFISFHAVPPIPLSRSRNNGGFSGCPRAIRSFFVLPRKRGRIFP